MSSGKTAKIAGEVEPVMSPEKVTFHEYAVLALITFPTGLQLLTLYPVPIERSALVLFQSANQPVLVVLL
jgi:hypothetical protein